MNARDAEGTQPGRVVLDGGGGAVGRHASILRRRRPPAGDIRSRSSSTLLRLQMGVQNAALRWFAARGDELAQLVSGGVTDPFPLYERVRASGPLVRSRLNMWVVTGHALSAHVLRDPRFGVADWPKTASQQALDLSLLELDPPDHARLRRLAAPAFRPRLVAGYRHRIQAVATTLLDGVDPAGFDLVGDVAWPLPITVITDLLGVDTVDHAAFASYGQILAEAVSGVTSMRQVRKLETAVADLTALFTDLMRQRRSAPRDDLISALVAAHDEDTMTARELVSLCQLLLVAGFETTVNLIGNAVHLLLDHPDQWKALVADPALATGAVEEVLRHQSPVQLTNRVAHEDVELAGQRLPAGSVVFLLIGAANRDPELFEDPHRFDISRTGGPEHLAFSSGAHYCLGATLARAEGVVALRALAERMPDLRRNGVPRYRHGSTIRGLVALPAAG